MQKNILIQTFFFFLICNALFAQQSIKYKTVDTTDLYMRKFNPPNFDASKTYPAMVFFFGGGWSNENKDQFINHAQYFAKRGLVCFLVDYRVINVHGTTPKESVKDAKSAMRFIRKNAQTYQIDPNKIIASGGSAGGHLVAATALIDSYNESTDDLAVSPVPEALVLFNPVIDNGPCGYGFSYVGDDFLKFSPLHNIDADAPPTVIFLGTNDNLIPVETVEFYKQEMEKYENRCDVFLYEGKGHGFFNYGNFENYKITLQEADKFLVSLGYLQDTPTVVIQ